VNDWNSGELRGEGVEAASQEDAAWFEAHPGRNFRLRDRIAGEYESLDVDLLYPPGTTPRTLVIQTHPGVRMRQPVAIFAHVKNDEMTDAQLFAFFKESHPLESQELLRKLQNVKLPGKPKQTGS
jgi:hypothetical protein